MSVRQFEEFSVARNYTKLIENQLNMIETHLRGTTDSEAKYLKNTLENLNKKVVLLQGGKSCRSYIITHRAFLNCIEQLYL